MRKIILAISITYSIHTLSYQHPGSESFVEIGGLNTKSVYDYNAQSPYAVLKLDYKRLSVEGFRANYNIIDNDIFKLGPLVNYTFPPFADDNAEHLRGINRTGFFDLGILTTISIPFGQLVGQVYQSHHPNSGINSKFSYASAIPLLPLKKNHIWFNFLFEYSFISKNTANHFFAVREDERTNTRNSYTTKNKNLFTMVLALWNPISNKTWLNITYKRDRYQNSITESPIVKNNIDTTIMIGLMYSFGKLD